MLKQERKNSLHLIRQTKGEKIKLKFLTVVQIVISTFFVAGAITTTAYSQRDFSKEILVYFVSGVERTTGPGKPVRVTSSAVKSVFDRYKIKSSALQFAFPNFNEEDTLAIGPEGRVIKMLNLAKIFVINVSDKVDRKMMVERLQKLPNVAFAELNSMNKPDVQPNDQYYYDPTKFQYQWSLDNKEDTDYDIDAPQAWDLYLGNPNNIIGILDGGVIGTHPDLTGKQVSGDSGEGSGLWVGHGTHVAGISVAFSGNDLTLKPEANWNGSSVITVYASDGKDMDSTKFNLTVDPMQDKPYNFNWVSAASDSINITQSNLTDTYDLKWNTSNEVDGETIDYLISASVGQFPAEMIHDTTDTSMTITYQDIIDHWYPNLAMLPRATLKFSVSATDGIDTVNVTGDDRVLFVSRYEYLSTEGEGIPTEFALHENYPNPFNPTTTLRFDLPQVSSITLTIYNMLGQKVRTFNMQNTSAGYHSITWDATNDFGQQVGAGVYLYQLQAKDFVKTRKMVLLK